MAYDANLVFNDGTVAVTATASSAALTLGAGTPRRGLWARVVVSAVSGTTPTALFEVTASTTLAGTYTTIATLEGGAIAAVGEYWLKFETSSNFVKLKSTITGTTPSFTFTAHVVDSRP